ncbi:MAG: hypothetical protein JXB85_13075 [Anaerolineales bacterium]|nr:hypothetical protein [Anaerolineales bacterium]
MLDNLRDQASSSAYFQEEEGDAPSYEAQPVTASPARRSIDEITGMGASQRFILAAIFLMFVCLLGSVLLVITGRVVLPFL